ncbi:protein cornichon homolog 4 [Cimex lectularius]|uniref:Uncharacterized protein n=1 Tax=Cimex lectularius TaxID=79782 RepID=A0A8I6TFE0_CIMLE|nr:protein cornichon homolog 4 [Cimex lectularius]
MFESWVFAFSLLDTGALLFLLAYFIITISDLECDYLNVWQCCAKLNIWIVPKLVAHGVLIPLFLLCGHWVLALINLPPVAWMAYEYLKVPLGNTGVYDPTEIHGKGELNRHMRNCMIYLGWYLISFFIYLYCLIISILNEDPLERAPTNVPEF